MNAQEAPHNECNEVANRTTLPGDDEMHDYVVSHIDEAVNNGWILPYYQPVIRTLTGKICGFEALARWDDPVYGLLPPAVFIPALEEAHLVHLLDSSIIHQVCQQYRAWANGGQPTVPISINLSRLDFNLCDIYSVVENAVREFGVPRRMLNIEITETVLATDSEFATSVVTRLHNAGYQVWMDDFGSGYSTLNILKDFEFDELKIDMEFLRHFNNRSKTILASVVDMAKKLGIETLAEGVETKEHSMYLRRIGCEKLQGYLFSKPLRCSSDEFFQLYSTFGVETASESLYVREVGSVNTLSMSERDLTAGSSSQAYATSMALAIVEYRDDAFKIIDSNRAFREGLAEIGVASVEEAELRINNTHRPLARQIRQLVKSIITDRYARVDFVTGEATCLIRAKHITSRDGKTALLVSIDNTLAQSERKRHERMDKMLAVMYTIYEHVDIIHLDKNLIEPVFGNIGLRTQRYAPNFNDIPEYFAKSEVYSKDRERFLEFMKFDTIVERIERGDDNFIIDFFRLRQQGGNYTWKMIGLILLPDQSDNQVMFCIRSTQWGHEGFFQTAFDHNPDDPLQSLQNADMAMTDASLWQALIQSDHLNLFWKDADRRFVGANRAFLDYYGLESVDSIAGKTDEDIGWHIDPGPFMSDEWRALNEGATIDEAVGNCIAHGEVRNIIANKVPVYRNGRVIGLVGYFYDIENIEEMGGGLNALPLHDELTGVLNYMGLESATWKYVDSYKRHGIDFAMISINIDSFEAINAAFGHEFGEKVLKRIADELVDIAGAQRVIGHVHSDRFVILAQGESDEELQNVCDAIEQRLLAISQVDGTECTIYALAGFSRFSKLGDVESMKRYNRDRRRDRRANWHGSSNGEDIITSSLL